MDRRLVILVPGRAPSPNARRNHWRKGEDAKLWRAKGEQAAFEAIGEWEARTGERWQPLGHATMAVAFIVPDRRARDWDNLIASVKSTIDGLVQAGVLEDDSNRVLGTLGPFEIVHEAGQIGTRFVVEGY